MPHKTLEAARRWSKKYRAKDPDKWRAYYKRYRQKWMTPKKKQLYMLRFRYGITPEAYEEMLRRQNGRCVICACIQTRRRLHVDHCHITGSIRGLLCEECNFGLGKFQDDARLLRRAISYLKTTKIKETGNNPCLF